MGAPPPRKKGLFARIFKTPTELGKRAHRAFQGDSEFSGAPEELSPHPGSMLEGRVEKLKRQFQGKSAFSLTATPEERKRLVGETLPETGDVGWEAREVAQKSKKK